MTATLKGPRVAAPGPQAAQTGRRSARPRAAELSLDLRARLAARDPLALEQVFEAYSPRIARFIRRLVGNEHLAEDLTQEVFLSLCKSLETYDPSRALLPWVLAVATNKVRDHWRSRPHQLALLEVEVPAAERPPFSALGHSLPELALEGRETSKLLAEAVSELPESMRAVLVLRSYEGFSFAEVAQTVQRSEVAVRKRYSRALEVLRRKLGAKLEFLASAQP